MGTSTIIPSNKKYLRSYMCIIHLTMRLQRGNIGFSDRNHQVCTAFFNNHSHIQFHLLLLQLASSFLSSSLDDFLLLLETSFTLFFVFFSLSCCSVFLGDVDSFNIMYLMKDSVISIRLLASVRLFTKITSRSISFINTKMVDISKLSSESNFKNISSNFRKCIYFMNQFVVFFFSVDELGEINSIHFLTLYLYFHNKD